MVVIRGPSIATLLLLTGLLLTACGEQAAQLNRGDSPPSFSLQRLMQQSDGERDRGILNFPEQLQGKIVAIRFWADWCPFCGPEMKAIEPVYQKYRTQGLEILAINVRQDHATARAFIRKLGISYNILLDADGQIARDYGVLGLPTTFFINRDGQLHNRIIGESTPEVFEKIVQELL